MIVTTHAIVLRSIKYNDTRVIAEMLTERFGRVSCVCTPSSSARALVKKLHLQPLTMLEISLSYRAKTDLQKLKSSRIEFSYSSMLFDERKLPVALFLSEFLYYATRLEQTNEPLFQFLTSSLQWFDAAQTSFANFHLVLMMHLSRFIGFFPNVDDYETGDYFDLLNGSFTPFRPTHDHFVVPEEAAHIGNLMRMGFESMHLFQLSRAQRNRCVEVILEYYKLHVPNFPDLRSLAVVQQLFV